MKDVSFDDVGMGTGSNKIELSILDSYRDALIKRFNILAESLDQYQYSIVFNTKSDKSLKVTANPGSGKTLCVYAKALKMVLIDKIDPCSMVLITFTNKAADEIRERYLNFFRQVVSAEHMVDIPLPHISTIHSFGLSVLYKVFGSRRTIATESHVFKLLKSIILEVLNIKKIEAETVKKMRDIIYHICSNNELHFFCIPYFSSGGVVSDVYLRQELSDCEHIRMLDRFSSTGIKRKLAGKDLTISKQLMNDIKDRYTNEVGFSIDTFTKILVKFIEKKALSHTMDFADMRLLPFYVFNQMKLSRELVWDTYKYYMIDESQDVNTMDFGLAVTCDKDSYEAFLK